VADPNSWAVLEDCKACLEDIQIANGFFTDAGLYVTLEPSQIPESQGALIALALDGLAPSVPPAPPRTHRQATLLMVGKVGTGIDNAQLSLHRLIADIDRALTGQQRRFGAGRAFPTFVSATPIPPDKGINWIGVEVRYTTHVLIG
jgi:hypothetical protein